MTFDELPPILKPREAQEFLRVGRNQLYSALASGALHSVKIGASFRIPKESITRLLEGAASGHQPEAARGPNHQTNGRN